MKCNNPDASPTKKQTWCIFCMTGKDVRDSGLTRGEMSNAIGGLKGNGYTHYFGEVLYTKKYKAEMKERAELNEVSARLFAKAGKVNPLAGTVGDVLESKKKIRKTVSTVWAKVLCRKAEAAGQKAMDELIASKTVQPMGVVEHENMLDDSSPVKQSWVVEGGACGFASIRVKCTNGPSRKFINQLKKAGIAGDQNTFKQWSKSDYYGGYMRSFTLIGGQSLAYKTAYASAYEEVLRAEGIDTWVWTKMD